MWWLEPKVVVVGQWGGVGLVVKLSSRRVGGRGGGGGVDNAGWVGVGGDRRGGCRFHSCVCGCVGVCVGG